MKKLVLPELQVKVTRKNKEFDKFKITRSSDVFDLAKHIFNSDMLLWQEEFIILCLSHDNSLIGVRRLSSGGTAGTVVDPKLIFSIALNACANNIILIHNHPSGTTKPSEADLKITKKLVEVGNALEMPVLDHVIIGGDIESYLSMADNGYM